MALDYEALMLVHYFRGGSRTEKSANNKVVDARLANPNFHAHTALVCDVFLFIFITPLHHLSSEALHTVRE